jgi:ferredoxin
LYPEIDIDKCIDCGLCEKVCPVINQCDSNTPLSVYAAKNLNDEQRLNSSSGGIFILIAEFVIKHGGVVFGARFDANWNVEHCYVETIEDLKPLLRSKYVQSRIGNTYIEAETFLKNGRKVLFVGTSCQIAGLKKFLRKDYESLITVDVICHGVPSPGVWRNYLSLIKPSRSEVVGKNTVLSSSLKSMSVITDINFREKQNGGYCWQKFGFVVQKSPSKGDKNSVLLSNNFYKNPFMKGFLANLYLRPSCYQCPSRNFKSESDITIGDYWGIDKAHPGYNKDNKGVSIVLLNTNKGAELFHSLDNVDSLASDISKAIKYNSVLVNSVLQNSKRKLFFESFKNNPDDFEKIVINLSKVSLFLRIMTKIKGLLIK